MKILHVIQGLPKAAGTSVFCGEVCNQLVALGHDVTIAICNPTVPNLYPLNPFVHLTSIESILHSTTTTSNYNLIHVHGLWSPILHRASNWAHSHNIPVVWSTHGMTAPWALKHKWWKKCLPWYLYQRWDLKRAQLIHCTSDFEVEWNHKLGFSRTFLAPLGTFLPEDKDASSIVDLDLRPRPKILLFVGRIYPVKALDRLIEAFAIAVRGERCGVSGEWRLRLVGPDQAGHMAELMSLCDRLGLSYSTPEQNGNNSTVDLDLRPRPSPFVQFAGPRFGEDLDAEYANCDALALVSHTENFGATVVDAMAHGKPVITSTKTPWAIVQANSNNQTIKQSNISSCCGWWIDNDVESLAAGLSELLNLSTSQRSLMGTNGRKLVEEKYTWSAVARTVQSAYEAFNCRTKK